MFIVNLQCSDGHSFEGWYDSAHDYYLRFKNSEISCPTCNNSNVKRKSSAAKLLKSSNKTKQKNFAHLGKAIIFHNGNHIKVNSEITMTVEIQKAIARIVQKIKNSNNNEKNRFTERVQETIMKHDSKEVENEQLTDEEGVPYFKIYISDVEKN